MERGDWNEGTVGAFHLSRLVRANRPLFHLTTLIQGEKGIRLNQTGSCLLTAEKGLIAPDPWNLFRVMPAKGNPSQTARTPVRFLMPPVKWRVCCA